MSSIGVIIISFLTYAAVPIAVEGFSRLHFNNIIFSKVIEEWKFLAEFFNLEPSSPNTTKFSWIKGFKLIASGFFHGYYFNCVWSKTDRNSIGKIICKIEVKNPKKLIFDLDKNKSFFKQGNTTLDDTYFKQNFNLNSNNANEIALLFDDTMIANIRKIFSRNLAAKLFIEKKEVDSAEKDLILDETDTYFLVYTNTEYPFQTKAERLFIQENLLLMLEIAQKIDGIN